ncbi:hypothetical protein [Streptomyces sp. NPDC048411]
MLEEILRCLLFVRDTGTGNISQVLVGLLDSGEPYEGLTTARRTT